MGRKGKNSSRKGKTNLIDKIKEVIFFHSRVLSQNLLQPSIKIKISVTCHPNTSSINPPHINYKKWAAVVQKNTHSTFL